MKRIYVANSVRFNRVRRSRLRRRERRKARKIEKKYRKIQIKSAIKSAISPDVAYRYRDRIIIDAPTVCSLSSNREEFFSFINLIRRTILDDRYPIFINFHLVEKMGVSAALILAAEIYRCRKLRQYKNGHSVMGNYPRTNSVKSTLSKIGFFNSIQVVDPGFEHEIPDQDDEVFIKMQSYKRVNTEDISAFATECLSYFAHLSVVARQRLNGAINEAISNALEHAFKMKGDYVGLAPLAWLCAVVNVEKTQFTIMVFDQGIGIPRTVPVLWKDRISHLLSAGYLSDSALIRIANELFRTSTGMGGRGQGFRTMRRFVEACNDGELRVFSNRGAYLYKRDEESELDDTTESMGGTLVWWRIKQYEQDF